MARNEIKLVTPFVEEKVNSALTLAFATCPLLRWMYPEPERYLQQFPGFVKYYCGTPYVTGSGAFVENGTKGALLWQTAHEHVDFNELVAFVGSLRPIHARTLWFGCSRSSTNIIRPSPIGI